MELLEKRLLFKILDVAYGGGVGCTTSGLPMAFGVRILLNFSCLLLSKGDIEAVFADSCMLQNKRRD